MWELPKAPPLQLFVDAAGSPARCAAILFTPGEWFLTEGVPSRDIVSRFAVHRDDQIVALESISILMGLSTFADKVHQQKVIVYSDNAAAEASARACLKSSCHAMPATGDNA